MKNIDRRRPWSTRYPSNAVEGSHGARRIGASRDASATFLNIESRRLAHSRRFDSPSPSILSFHSFIRDNNNKYKTSVSSVGRSRTRMMCLSVLSDSKRAYKITWNLQFFSFPLLHNAGITRNDRNDGKRIIVGYKNSSDWFWKYLIRKKFPYFSLSLFFHWINIGG